MESKSAIPKPEPQSMESKCAIPKSEPQSMEGVADVDWRSQLGHDQRQKIIGRIMEKLKKYLPVRAQANTSELHDLAERFEDKIYIAAKDQADYLRKISIKLLSMETRAQNSAQINPSTSTTAVGSQNILDSAASLGRQSQLGNQAQETSMPVISQPSMQQPVSTQNLECYSGPASMQPSARQGSAGMQTAISAISRLPQCTLTNGNQPSSLQSMPGVSVNKFGHSSGQGPPSNMYANSLRQLQGRQQQPTLMAHQHQSQNSIMYHPAIQQHMPKQMQQLPPHLMQVLAQQNQLQPSQQQPPMQVSSAIQSGLAALQQTQPSTTAPKSGLQQQSHQTSILQSVSSPLQQHSQSVLRQHRAQLTIQQSSPLQQQPAGISHQASLKQQQLMQSNTASMQRNWLVSQQNNASDQKLHQLRLVEQKNILGMQQKQQMLNQQNHSLHQQQQLGSQGSRSGLQQQQLLGSQPNLSTVQQLCSMNILQQTKNTSQHQSQQNSPAMLHTQSHQMPCVQSQPTQLQQQMPVQQRPIPLQQEMQQSCEASGGFQSQNVTEQQKQVNPEACSNTSLGSTVQIGNLDTAELQEEAYQKIKSMKEAYFQWIVDFSQKVCQKMQQQEALGPVAKQSEQYKRLENCKVATGRWIQILQMPKGSIHPDLLGKIDLLEKQIFHFLNGKGQRVAQQPQTQQQFQQGRHVPPVEQQQPSEAAQIDQHDRHLNQSQPLSSQVSGASLQPTPTSTRYCSMPVSQLGIQTSHLNIVNLTQPGVNVDSTQANSLGSLQQEAINSVQNAGIGSLQNVMNTSPQNSIDSIPQNSFGMLQSNASSLQPGCNVLQQHLKQEQQHMMQTQQMNQQVHQHHLQQKHQLLHQQPALQRKQQQATQLTQCNQTNEVNEMHLRHGSGIKLTLHQQHYAAAQRHNLYNQLLKTGLLISSPQNHQAPSPQISQHSSPQIDQHVLLSPQTQAGTPLHSSNSPMVAPSPSTPVAPSSIPVDSERQHSVVSSLANSMNIGNQRSKIGPLHNQSLVVGTPGISASPLLEECTSLDGSHDTISTTAAAKSTAVEGPLSRLVKVVQSLSPEALETSMREVGFVVSMIDQIAGSAPGNSSRATVGEDLVAITKCSLQAKAFMSQDVSGMTKKTKRNMNAMPLNTLASVWSLNDNFKRSSDSATSDLESTASSSTKRQKAEVNQTLLEEIREINQQLVETIVRVSREDADSVALAAEVGDGTIVKLSYSAVACSSDLKYQFLSTHTSPIMLLRLLIPINYPRCSPILLDKLPADISPENEDLVSKVKSRFSLSLRGFSQPMSLRDMAKTWDVCARGVIAEFAQQIGGGSFSSRYGVWDCVGV